MVSEGSLAVIVAGGLGTRARAMTGAALPKALLPIGGIPIIERQIKALAAQGFSKIVILAGHLGELIRDYVHSNIVLNNIEVNVHVEELALGTAGAVISARRLLNCEHMVVIFGDLLFEFDFIRLLKEHRKTNAAVTIVCRPNDHPAESDLVELDGQNQITGLLSKKNRPPGDHRNLVPTGIYVLSRSELNSFSINNRLDFFQEVFPQLLKGGKKMMAARSVAYIHDIGTLKGREAAERDLVSGRIESMHSGALRPTIFFDIDGVLNDERPELGILFPDDIRLIQGAGQALSQLNQTGHLAVGITNRPQLAKGQISAQELDKIFSRLEMRLADDGGYLDRIYFCPHHPEAGHKGEITSLKIACDCRKPGPGLFNRAMHDLPIDPRQSAMIGDTWRDIVAAKSKNIYAYGVRTGYGCRELPQGVQPDLMFRSVVEAVNFCLNYRTLADSILQRIDQLGLVNQRVLIGIAGVSQSGKSCLAHAIERVCREQNRTALRVPLDQWLIPAHERNGAGVYERTRAASFNDIYKNLKTGKPVSANGYNLFTRGPSLPVSYVAPPNSIIIVEGILACSAPGISELDLSIFIEMPTIEAEKRQRELLEWKNLSLDAIDMLMQDRLSDELNIISAQQQRVDVTLPYPSLFK